MLPIVPVGISNKDVLYIGAVTNVTAPKLSLFFVLLYNISIDSSRSEGGNMVCLILLCLFGVG